jgi:hypothetical protein
MMEQERCRGCCCKCNELFFSPNAKYKKNEKEVECGEICQENEIVFIVLFVMLNMYWLLLFKNVW